MEETEDIEDMIELVQEFERERSRTELREEVIQHLQGMSNDYVYH